MMRVYKLTILFLSFVLFLEGCAAFKKSVRQPAVVQTKIVYKFPSTLALYSEDSINLSQPTDVVQFERNYYVSDSMHSRICVYDKEGVFKGILNVDTNILFEQPTYMYIVKGDLYVLDSGSKTLYVISLLDRMLKKKIIINSLSAPGRFVVLDNTVFQVFDSNKVFFYKLPKQEQTILSPEKFLDFKFQKINALVVSNKKIIVADLNRILFFSDDGKKEKELYLPELSNLSVLKALNVFNNTLLIYNAYNKKVYLYAIPQGFARTITFETDFENFASFVFDGAFFAAVDSRQNKFMLFTTKARKLLLESRRRIEEKDYLKAIELLEAALVLSEDPGETAEIKEELGRVYFYVGQYDKAISYLKIESINDDMRFTLANIYLAKKQYEEALNVLTPLFSRKDVYSDSAALLKAKIFELRGDIKKSLNILEQTISQHPTAVLLEYYFQLTEKSGQINRMLKFLKQLYGHSDDKHINLLIARKIADESYDMALYSLASKFYKELVNKYYDDIDLSKTYKRLGECLIKLEKYEDAIDAYKMFLYVEKDYEQRIKAKFIIGEIYFNLLEFEEAEKYYLEIVQDYPDSEFFTKAIWRLAEMFSTRREYDKAIMYFKEYYKYARHTEKGVEALFNVAEIYFNRKRYDEAIEYYQKILMNYPGSRYEPNILQKLGNIYEIKGDKDTAILYYEKLVKKYPEAKNYPKIMSRLKALRSGK